MYAKWYFFNMCVFFTIFIYKILSFRLSKHRLDKGKSDSSSIKSEDSCDSIGSSGELYKGFPPGWWSFSRQPITHPLTRLPEAEEPQALAMFVSVLAWAGLATSPVADAKGETQPGGAEEHVAIAQGLMEKCLRSESLLAELYMQLIKQVCFLFFRVLNENSFYNHCETV